MSPFEMRFNVIQCGAEPYILISRIFLSDTTRWRSMGRFSRAPLNKTLWQQPEQFDQTASTACWIGAYSRFIFLCDDAPAVTPLASKLWLRERCCLGRLLPALTVWHRLVRLPWSGADLMDEMTLPCTVITGRPGARGPGVRRKQITLRAGVINLFWPIR